MEHTPEQLAHFKAEFARRRRSQFLVAVPFIAVVLAATLFEQQLKQVVSGVPEAALGGGALAAVAAIGVFSWRNWRCPACDSYLGRSTGMQHCPRCGVPLK